MKFSEILGMGPKEAFDHVRANIATAIAPQVGLKERIGWKPQWTIKRFDSDRDCRKERTYDIEDAKDLFLGKPQVSIIDGNLLCKNGLNNLWKLAATSGGTQWSATTGSYLATGTSSTAAAITDTALGGGAVYVQQDSTYPIISGTNTETCTWRSTFDGSTANQAWAEFGLFQTNAGANMLNHVISAQGTKTSGQSWQLSLAITLS